MRIDSALKNAWWKLFSLGVSSLMPLLVVPHLIDVFGVEYYGSLELLLTQAAFFQIFIGLGSNVLGQRFVSDSDGEVDDNALSIIKITHIATLVVLSFYILYLVGIHSAISNIKWYYIFFIVTATFNIDWVYEGRMMYKEIALRNIVVKIVQVSLILYCVKESSDVYLYLLFLFVPPLIGHLWYFGFIWVRIKTFYNVKIGASVVSSLAWIFLLQNSAMLYTQTDKLFLGHNLFEVGIYSISQKLSIYVLGVLNAVVIVFYPVLNRMRGLSAYPLVVRSLLRFMNILVSYVGVVIILMRDEISLYFLNEVNNQYLVLLSIWVLRFGVVMNESIVYVQILLVNGEERISAWLFFIFGLINLLSMYLFNLDSSLTALISTFCCEIALLMSLRFFASRHVGLCEKKSECLGDIAVWMTPILVLGLFSIIPIILWQRFLLCVLLLFIPVMGVYRFNKLLVHVR